MQTVLDCLEQSRSLIDTPDKWLQGAFSNNEVQPRLATCFCTYGAVTVTYRKMYGEGCGLMEMGEIENKACDYLTASVPKSFSTGCVGVGFGHIIRYNDDPETTHSDIMAMFDGAITLAKNEETK